MSLPLGARLGPYEITAAIGAGGMGEVYRGRDGALNRDVAIKVLPAAMASEPERLARFKREAQLLASLNHPNIAHIYGFEAATLPDGQTVHFLAMEMVEGEDLAERLKRGAIPVEDAIAIAHQIADGLEEAHERGIIHRDLKPANIKVTPDGKVKVLDFGLAKALEANSETSATNSQLAQSPTISRHMTEAGMIMGTAAYMSPEQARGKPVDRRTDIWAFGVVLFEMLTGRRLFAGETLSDTLAAVLKTDPDWSLLPKDTPPAIARLLRRCLERDTKRRLGWIGGFRHELDESGSRGSETPTPLPRASHPAWRRALPLAGAVLTGALLAVAFQGRTPGSPASHTSAQVTRLSLEGSEDVDAVAISPDGTRVALRRGRTLQLRRMGDFAATPIKIPNVPGLRDFVFSPDGESMAFTMGASLKRVPVSGDLITDIGELPDFSLGCIWSGSDIYCGVGAAGVVRMPAAGGPGKRVVTLSPGEHAATPQLLPDGDTLIFTLAPGGAFPDWTRSQIVAQSLSSGKREVVIPSGSDARYLADGYLTWAVDGVWFGSAFDLKSRRTTGTPVSIIEGVARVTPGGQPSGQICLDVSATGTVVYASGPAHAQSEKQIVFTDRAGHERVLRLPPDQYETPRVSPDGRRLAMSIEGRREAAVWIYDLSETQAIRRLTFSGRSRMPVWSPDGTQLAFQSDRGGDAGLYIQSADGSTDARRLTTADSGTVHLPESWSRDGRSLSFSAMSPSGAELWLLSLGSRRAERFADLSARAPLNSAFSPNGRWIAYTQRLKQDGLASGTASVYVQPVPATGARYLVSDANDGSHHPFWSPDGKELFFFGDHGLVSAAITTSGTVTAGRAVRTPGFLPSNTNALGPLGYDITPDGREFVSSRVVSGSAAGDASAAERHSVKVVLNWFEELKDLATVKP